MLLIRPTVIIHTIQIMSSRTTKGIDYMCFTVDIMLIVSRDNTLNTSHTRSSSVSTIDEQYVYHKLQFFRPNFRNQVVCIR